MKDYKLIISSLKTGWLTHGPNNLKFEKIFSKFIGVKHAISMNSCTSALECALKVLNKKGEVIKADFGKPFAEEVVTVERVVTDITRMEPIAAMKEVNKVIKRDGKYKNLTDKDVDKI